MRFLDKLRVAPGKCLPGRYKDYSGHPCLDVCTKRAITLNPLEIDYGLCDDCGICANACPAGALSVKESFLAEVASQAVSDTGKELRIRCSSAGGRSAAVTCLGALDYAFLDALCLKSAKDLGLLAGDCENCGRATGGGIIRSNIDAANRLLLLFGRRERIFLTRSADRHDLESGPRREMFRGIGRAISRFVPEPEDPERDRDPGPVPARQRRSLEIIRELEEGQRNIDPCVPLPFIGKEIDADKCDGCNGLIRCVSFCPTDALEYSAEGGSAEITFKACRCIGCGLCESACRNAAVKSFTLKSGQVEELRLTKTLMGFEAQECGGCGGISIGMIDGLCRDCQQRKRKLEWESV
ncbi:MAG: 4Fe-4S binding protein [Deltaproteobacteria bacterium]|nr:4Fe-4S binding protein [Deltaproteobacteria bacterium]